MVPIFEYQYMYIHLGPSDMSVVLLYVHVCVYANMIKSGYRAVHACKLIDFVYVVKRRANV